MTSYIISISKGGLSNRIKCLISSMKIANETKRELLLYWPKNIYCNCHFKDLFDYNIKEIDKEELKKIIKSKEFEYYGDSLKKIKNLKKFIITDNSTLIGFNKDIHLMYEKIPKEIRKEIIFYLSKLKINKDILDEVKRFSRKINKNTIGVHIRKGDFNWLKSGIGKISNEEEFINEIKKEIASNPKTSFFLSTEDINTEKRFKKEFKGKIINYPKKNYKREDEGSVKEALIELILLSKTKKILGTFGSTFTEMSWYFGDSKKDIKIIVNKESLKEFLKNKKKQNNFINIIKKFIYELLISKQKRLLNVSIK